MKPKIIMPGFEISYGEVRFRRYTGWQSFKLSRISHRSQESALMPYALPAGILLFLISIVLVEPLPYAVIVIIRIVAGLLIYAAFGLRAYRIAYSSAAPRLATISCLSRLSLYEDKIEAWKSSGA